MSTTPEPGGLRHRHADALTREHYRRARERIEASPEDHCAGFADAILPVVEAETAALRQRAENAEDRLRKATDAYTQLHAATTGTEATGDRWRQRAEQAERELRNAERRLDAAERIAAALEAERDQARDAIATERRGRLAAEAAVRRARGVHNGGSAENAVLCVACCEVLPCPTLRALDAEQPEESR